MTMTSFHHVPVLFEDVVELLAPTPDAHLVDCTVGGGSHAHALASQLGPHGTLLALDQDPDALAAAGERLAGLACRTLLRRANFVDLPKLLQELPEFGPIDVLLADLGVSSPQLDRPERGFSFAADGPLDMRMAQEGPSVADLLGTLEAEELAEILRDGDVPRAHRVAQAILQAFHVGQMRSTQQLARLCERVLGRGHRHVHPATLVFQALRIAVNRELEVLSSLLDALPGLCAPGARVGFIAFHSGEDRLVKSRFRNWASPCTCPPQLPYCACGRTPLGRTLKDRAASDAESERNPRARSARLRVFEFAGSA